MKLKPYLKKNKISQASFARMLGYPPQTIERYVNEKRIPEPEILQAISVITNGFVTANDFYDIKSKRSTNLEEGIRQ